MTAYAVSREIAADPDTVWGLLSDATTWAAWNPSVLSIEGPIRVGEKVRLVSMVNPDRTFSLKVDEVSPPSRMVWSDGMPLGLFTGVRTYTLEPTDTGTTFHMEEAYSGVMAPLITRAIPDLTESFEVFADGLKQGAEARTA